MCVAISVDKEDKERDGDIADTRTKMKEKEKHKEKHKEGQIRRYLHVAPLIRTGGHLPRCVLLPSRHLHEVALHHLLELLQ